MCLLELCESFKDFVFESEAEVERIVFDRVLALSFELFVSELFVK
jgi:hypothetical protein